MMVLRVAEKKYDTKGISFLLLLAKSRFAFAQKSFHEKQKQYKDERNGKKIARFFDTKNLCTGQRFFLVSLRRESSSRRWRLVEHFFRLYFMRFALT